MQRQHPNGPDIVPYDTATNAPIDVLGKVNTATSFTLTAAHTYYYPLDRGAQEGPFETVHVVWDNAAVITITIEDTDGHDYAIYDTTVGHWVQYNPTSGVYVAATSGTITNVQLVVAGGTAGGAIFYLSARGELRSRVKIVVGGTGGVVRVTTHAKD